MTSIQLIAVDLDGTLLHDDETLSPQGVSALKKAVAMGVHVVIATGRRLASARQYAQQIGLSDPLIVVDGAQIASTPQGMLWMEQVIPLHIAKQITRYADSQGWELTTVIDSTICYRQRPGQSVGNLADDCVVYNSNVEAVTAPPLRILAHEPEAIAGLEAYCQQLDHPDIRYQLFHHNNGMIRSICIFSGGADKGTALQFICHKLNISPSQVLAIGDYDNDLSMFSVAGWSVAMGNAQDHIKAQSDMIAPTNEDGGVAWAVQEFVLRREGI